jgi:hypothetical protein
VAARQRGVDRVLAAIPRASARGGAMSTRPRRRLTAIDDPLERAKVHPIVRRTTDAEAQAIFVRVPVAGRCAGSRGVRAEAAQAGDRRGADRSPRRRAQRRRPGRCSRARRGLSRCAAIASWQAIGNG